MALLGYKLTIPYYRVFAGKIELPLGDDEKIIKIIERLFDIHNRKILLTILEKIYLIAGAFDINLKDKVRAPVKYARHAKLPKGYLSIEVNDDLRIFYTVDPRNRIIIIHYIEGHKRYGLL